MSKQPEPPPATELNYTQYSGRACCWCGKSLLDVTGVKSAGIARGSSGVHVLDIEVYACPDCAAAPSQTPVRPVPRAQLGRAGSIASTQRRPSTTGGIT